MKHLLTSTLFIAGASIILTGCATQGPQRIDTGGTSALTTMGLNIADLMDAATSMTRELLVAPAITQFEARNGRPPVISYGPGSIRNATGERITIEQVADRVMSELLRSGQVEVVAKGAEAIRASELDNFLNDGKINLQAEADFYLEGVIMKNTATLGNVRENNYTFSMSLNNRERRQVWSQVHDITKQGANSTRRGGVTW